MCGEQVGIDWLAYPSNAASLDRSIERKLTRRGMLLRVGGGGRGGRGKQGARTKTEIDGMRVHINFHELLSSFRDEALKSWPAVRPSEFCRAEAPSRAPSGSGFGREPHVVHKQLASVQRAQEFGPHHSDFRALADDDFLRQTAQHRVLAVKQHRLHHVDGALVVRDHH